MHPDAVDVIPMDRASDALLAEILRDGVLIHGSEDALEAYRTESRSGATEREQLDDVLEDIEALV